MFFTPQEQLLAIFGSFLLGAALAVLYDALRAIRWETRAGAVLTALFDLLFWAVFLAALFEFSIMLAPGQTRYYILAGAALGAFVYFRLLSPFCLFLFRLTLRGTAALFRDLARICRVVSADVSRLLCFFAAQYRRCAERAKNFVKTPFLFRKKGIK